MFLTKKNFAINCIALATSSILLFSCGSETPKEDEIVATTEDSSATIEVSEVSYSLPSPLQIASIFKKSGLTYKSGITTNVKDPSKYTTNLSKSLNLGVYSADLSYTVLNKQNQEAMNYMKASRQLADNLGIGSIFKEGNLAERFEKNLTNEDSLAYIIAELQMVTDMYLDENDQQQITSIVFAGAWIESMYIGGKVYEKSKDKSLNSKITEQLTILGSIINALKTYEAKEAAIVGLVADLSAVKAVYDELPTIKANAGKEEEDSEVDVILTDEELSTLSKKIEELRTKFING